MSDARSDTQAVIDRLRAAIVSGQLERGVELRPARLADDYDATIAVIGKALAVLEAEGLVETPPSGSAIVRDRRTLASRIADDIRDAIRSGKLAAGDRLATDRQLAEQYNVHRVTVHRALNALKSEGIVEARRGSGVYVREHRPPRRLTHNLDTRLLATVPRSSGPANGSTVELTISHAKPPAWAAQQLDLAPDQETLVRSARYVIDGEPVQLADTYIPTAIANGTALEHETIDGGIYAAFETLGWTVGHIEEEVGARMPTPDEAHALDVGPGTPLLEVRHTSRTPDGRAFEATYSRLPADRNVLAFDLPV